MRRQHLNALFGNTSFHIIASPALAGRGNLHGMSSRLLRRPAKRDLLAMTENIVVYSPILFYLHYCHAISRTSHRYTHCSRRRVLSLSFRRDTVIAEYVYVPPFDFDAFLFSISRSFGISHVGCHHAFTCALRIHSTTNAHVPAHYQRLRYPARIYAEPALLAFS